MPYQYLREPLTAEEADQLANASETTTEQLPEVTVHLGGPLKSTRLPPPPRRGTMPEAGPDDTPVRA